MRIPTGVDQPGPARAKLPEQVLAELKGGFKWGVSLMNDRFHTQGNLVPYSVAAVVVRFTRVVLLPKHRLFAFSARRVFLSVGGLYLMLNASFRSAAQVLGLRRRGNVRIPVCDHAGQQEGGDGGHSRSSFASLLSGGVCPFGLFPLLLRVDLTTPWRAYGPSRSDDDATVELASISSPTISFLLSWLRSLC